MHLNKALAPVPSSYILYSVCKVKQRATTVVPDYPAIALLTHMDRFNISAIA